MENKKEKNRKPHQKQQQGMNTKQLFSSLQFKNGTYSVGMTAIIVAIVVVINLMVNQLPSNIKKIDMSSNKIYTIGETTKEVLKGLTKDITITMIASPSSIDTRISTLVNNYKSLSNKIKVEAVDPVLHPTVLSKYDTEENTIVVSCTDTNKNMVISFQDIIKYDEMTYAYYGQYVETEFDGEGLLTSAIDYVINEVQKKIYMVEGHRESDLSDAVNDLIKKANMETATVNLMTEGKIPKDCDLLLINAPLTDIAEDEKTLLEGYLKEGGKVMVLLGETDPLKNLESILREYGLEVVDGYIADTERFFQNSYYAIFPNLVASHEANSNAPKDALALVNNVYGMKEVTPSRDTILVESFMTTSDHAYAVTDTEEVAGNYILGATATETLEEREGKLTVIAAGSLINEYVTNVSESLYNLDLFMNLVTTNFEDINNISIPAKSLEMTYNTILSPGMWNTLFIFVIPIGILVIGFVIWMKRRRA